MSYRQELLDFMNTCFTFPGNPCRDEGVENGSVEHEECDRFYQCVSWVTFDTACPPGTVFGPDISDPSRYSCDFCYNINRPECGCPS